MTTHKICLLLALCCTFSLSISAQLHWSKHFQIGKVKEVTEYPVGFALLAVDNQWIHLNIDTAGSIISKVQLPFSTNEQVLLAEPDFYFVIDTAHNLVSKKDAAGVTQWDFVIPDTVSFITTSLANGNLVVATFLRYFSNQGQPGYRFDTHLKWLDASGQVVKSGSRIGEQILVHFNAETMHPLQMHVLNDTGVYIVERCHDPLGAYGSTFDIVDLWYDADSSIRVNYLPAQPLGNQKIGCSTSVFPIGNTLYSHNFDSWLSNAPHLAYLYIESFLAQNIKPISQVRWRQQIYQSSQSPVSETLPCSDFYRSRDYQSNVNGEIGMLTGGNPSTLAILDSLGGIISSATLSLNQPQHRFLKATTDGGFLLQSSDGTVSKVRPLISSTPVVEPTQLTADFEISVSPNPTTDFISISSTGQMMAVVEVVNSLGISEFSQKVSGVQNLDVQTQFLPTGKYWVKVMSTSGEVAWRSFIKM